MPGDMGKRKSIYLFKAFAFSNLGFKRFNIDIEIVRDSLNNCQFHDSNI